eukprot:CAMPEP_0116022472 /NCGR_PEP_ID=MMETSP0321-20121206/11011_1 /TAXON_ID=163516 /ORGANISM="Leptocylindrus danicus var. danicus, Strain B650" /LENGTH=245 /DNA_ID=CAMNT_0003493557 /DNA_START=16 /DNA_END=753 /DNA_ORIENTATION=+
MTADGAGHHDMETIIDTLGETIPAPNFTIPDGCEVWAIHMPLNISLNTAALNDVQIDFNSHHKHSMGKLQLNVGSNTNDVVEYSMIHAEPSSHMRVLVMADDGEGVAGDEDTHFMKIGPAFDREIKLISTQRDDDVCVPNGNDEQQSSRKSITRAYEHVPQMKNLKRRLIVPGQYAFGKPSNDVLMMDNNIATRSVNAGNEEDAMDITPVKKIKVDPALTMLEPTPKTSSKKKKKEKKVKKEKKK